MKTINVTTLKMIDVAGQVLVIITGIAWAVADFRNGFFAAYFLTGAWQLTSALISYVAEGREHPFHAKKGRFLASVGIYALLIGLFLVLQNEAALMLLALGLLLAGIGWAAYYLWLSCAEWKLLAEIAQQRELVDLTT